MSAWNRSGRPTASASVTAITWKNGEPLVTIDNFPHAIAPDGVTPIPWTMFGTWVGLDDNGEAIDTQLRGGASHADVAPQIAPGGPARAGWSVAPPGAPPRRTPRCAS